MGSREGLLEISNCEFKGLFFVVIFSCVGVGRVGRVRFNWDAVLINEYEKWEGKGKNVC